MNSESEFQAWFLKHGFPENSHIVELEISSYSGVPDVNIALPNRDIWIEFKWMGEGDTVTLRPSQFRWFLDRKKANTTGDHFVVWGVTSLDENLCSFGVLHGSKIIDPRIRKTDGLFFTVQADTNFDAEYFLVGAKYK